MTELASLHASGLRFQARKELRGLAALLLLSHRHQDTSGVCCHVLMLTCVSILNKFPASAIKQPELLGALLQTRAAQRQRD